MTAADKAEVATLEARPLKFPTLLPGGVCRPDTQDPVTGYWGSDPVLLAGGPHTGADFGDYYDVSAITNARLTGPVLMRGSDLKAPNHPIVFVPYFMSSSVYFAGPVYGTDPNFGPQYAELVLDTSHPTASTASYKGSDYHQFFWRQGIAKGWTGCIGFQIDGVSFSEDIAVNVGPHAGL